LEPFIGVKMNLRFTQPKVKGKITQTTVWNLRFYLA
jgi:hypothetical protein